VKRALAITPLYGEPSLSARSRRERAVTDRRSMAAWPTDEGRSGTWHRETSRRPGVLPALGRSDLGKVRVGPDAKAAVRHARGRAGTLERGRRRGLPENVRLATFD
jgi:hypothetical protein